MGWKRRALLFGFWTGLGLFFSVQMLVSYASRGSEVRWVPTLIYQFSQWYAWGLLTPLVLALARRYPLDRAQWGRALRVLAPAGLVIAPAQVALALTLRSAALLLVGVMNRAQVADLFSGVPAQLLIGSFDSLVTYALILGVYYAFDVYRRHRARDLRTSQLEAQLAQAQLTALKMQLHPHFLFNTLHSISALVHDDPEAAERMIARLSDLLRLALDTAGAQEVTLRQELDFLERYLAVERIRFQDRLAVELDVDPETLDAQVPNLILQPLVENAIRHGIAPRPEPGTIRIRAARADGVLTLQVCDDGPGLRDGGDGLREGVGLANTRLRLHRLYGDAHRFSLCAAAAGGLEVTLEIPA